MKYYKITASILVFAILYTGLHPSRLHASPALSPNRWFNESLDDPLNSKELEKEKPKEPTKTLTSDSASKDIKPKRKLNQDRWFAGEMTQPCPKKVEPKQDRWFAGTLATQEKAVPDQPLLDEYNLDDMMEPSSSIVAGCCPGEYGFSHLDPCCEDPCNACPAPCPEPCPAPCPEPCAPACGTPCVDPCLPSACPNYTQMMYLGIKQAYRGGIGYREGYTSAESQILSNIFSVNTSGYMDIRFDRFTNAEYAGNFGLGFRHFSSASNNTYGINGYYDSRKIHGSPIFSQASVGVELLGEFDCRLNAYFPVQFKKKKTGVELTDYEDGYEMTEDEYIGSLSGVYFEIGKCIESGCNFSAYGSVGQYYLEVDKCTKAFGGRTQLTLDFWKYFRLEGLVSYDTLFKLKGQAVFGIHFKFGGPKKRSPRNNLFRRPYHNEIIPLAKRSQFHWNW